MTRRAHRRGDTCGLSKPPRRSDAIAAGWYVAELTDRFTSEHEPSAPLFVCSKRPCGHLDAGHPRAWCASGSISISSIARLPARAVRVRLVPRVLQERRMLEADRGAARYVRPAARLSGQLALTVRALKSMRYLLQTELRRCRASRVDAPLANELEPTSLLVQHVIDRESPRRACSTIRAACLRSRAPLLVTASDVAESSPLSRNGGGSYSRRARSTAAPGRPGYGRSCRDQNNVKRAWWARWSSCARTWWASTPPSYAPKVWEASGHARTSLDPLASAATAGSAYRIDELRRVRSSWMPGDPTRST